MQLRHKPLVRSACVNTLLGQLTGCPVALSDSDIVQKLMVLEDGSVELHNLALGMQTPNFPTLGADSHIHRQLPMDSDPCKEGMGEIQLCQAYT